MPFKKGYDPNRSRNPSGVGGRPDLAVRVRARNLLERHKVLEALAKRAGQGEVAHAKLLLQLAGYLRDEEDAPVSDLSDWTDEELLKRIEILRGRPLPSRPGEGAS